MTLAELRAELQARGFQHLTDSRANLLLNRAISRLDGMYDWPYTEDSATGTAPLSIPTLRHVQAVTNETQGYVLEQSSYDDILDLGDTSLSTAGTAAYWYRSAPAGDPVVNVYPSTSDTIGVQFFAVPAELSADADVPSAPSRFHPLYVLLAQQMAEIDRGNIDVASALEPMIQQQINEMVRDLLPQQSAMYVRITGSSCDW